MNKLPLIIATVGLLSAASWVSAQVANISTTAASSFNALNLTTTMQNASPTTSFSNDGYTMLVIKTGASAVSATLKTQAQSISQNGYGTTALSDIPLAIPANSVVLAGPFPQARWNTSQGTVNVTITPTVAGVSVSAVSQAQ